MKTTFVSASDLYDHVNDVVKNYIDISMEPCVASDLDLDNRAGTDLYIDTDFVAVRLDLSNFLEYYGGFEYVDPKHVKIMGDYIFYSALDDRVEGCIDAYMEKFAEAED